MPLLSRSVRGVSLDAMGTLIFLNEPPHLIYYDILKNEGVPSAQINELRKNENIFFSLWQQAEAKLPHDVRKNFLDRYKLSAQNPISFWQLLFEVIFEYFSLSQEMLPSVLQKALAVFSQSQLWRVEETFFQFYAQCQEKEIPLWVTSNFDSRLPKLLHNLKIAHCFKKIIYSEDIGYEKPATQIFSSLAKQANLPAQKIAHVGDTWTMDVEGALNANMQAVFYNPQKKPAPLPLVTNIENLLQLADFF